MYDDIVKTKILIQSLENWCGLKDRLAHSVPSINSLSQKSDGIWFYLQSLPGQKEAKSATPIWLWRRRGLVQEVQTIFYCLSHFTMHFTVRQ